MKKVILYVFSGTGNTQLVAELYKKYLTDCETTIYKLGKRAEGQEIPSPRDYDLVGLGYPVHGFNAPLVMNNFCKSLPAFDEAAGRKKTFIFLFALIVFVFIFIIFLFALIVFIFIIFQIISDFSVF